MKRLLSVAAAVAVFAAFALNRGAPRTGRPPAPASAVRTETAELAGFETGVGGWTAVPSGRVETSSRATGGARSLMVVPAGPGDLAVQTISPRPWFGWDRLALDAYLPPDAPPSVEMLTSVTDEEGFWYQNARTVAATRGWNRIVLDLRDGDAWIPVGHRRAWSGFVLQQVKVLNVKFLGKSGRIPHVCLDRVRLERTPARPEESLRILNLRFDSLALRRLERFEARFELSREFENPFDPSCVSVTAAFVRPDGRTETVPGFFFQEYGRELREGRERVYPVGRPCWAVRYAPALVGRYSVRIAAAAGGATAKAPPVSFSVAPSAARGYVRAEGPGGRYFVLGDGSFFYPVGLNLVSPWDNPYGERYVAALPTDLGTYIYDDYFRKMAGNGMNFARVWMGHWWLALEWNRDFGPFHGVGRYSLQNAWRLDHILEDAERRGIYILLTFQNHTQLTRYESGWDKNPYNAANGGPLSAPADFFTDPAVRELYRRKLRYIAARWGYSQSVFAWDFWSEVDLTIGYNPIRVREWHREMAGYLKGLDGRHMASTHFCYHSRTGQIMDLPEMDFAHSNAWVNVDGLPDSQAGAIRRFWEDMKGLRKPSFVSEYGGHYVANPPEVLRRDLHTGLWSGFMTPLGTTPLFWWWNFVHEEDLYPEYRALAAFARGEDRRGRSLEAADPAVSCPGAWVEACALAGPDRAYVWAYDAASALRVPYGERTVSGATVTLAGPAPGRYEVEFWDTRAGKVAGRAVAVADRRLTISLPDFRGDIACKVRRAAGEGGG